MFSIFRNINRFAEKSKLLDVLAIFSARYLIYLMIGYLLLFAIITNNLGLFFFPLLSGLFAAFFIDKIIYYFYKERRPSEFKNTKILIPVPSNPSFPSRHASFIFGISFYLFFYNLPLAIIFIILSCFVGMARVFSGVHWFRDILAGILVGFISTLAVSWMLTNIKL